MEFLFEALIDLILEGSIEASKSKKVPRIIRYILIFLIISFFLSVIGLIIWMGIDVFDKNPYGSIFIIGIGVLLLILCIIRFRKIYLEKKN